MKKILLISALMICGITTLKAQNDYVLTTRIVNGYFVGKLGSEIAINPMTLKIEYELNNFGAKRNVRVVAVSQNGVDFTYSTSPKYCNISEEWSNYMAKRNGQSGFPVNYYKSIPWKSGNNQTIDNFYLFNSNSMVP